MNQLKQLIEEYVRVKEIELVSAQIDKMCIEDDVKKMVFNTEQEKKQTNMMLEAAKAKEQMCLRQLLKAQSILKDQ